MMDNAQGYRSGQSYGSPSDGSQEQESGRDFQPIEYWNQVKDKTVNADPEHLANRLGWFSIGLGLTEVLAPRAFCRFLGVRDRSFLVRMMGLREIAAGV